ncbi:response regulator [Thiothrix winogradskyi]|uniref:histidine kinase n=1 Tax=Thiothrix winogradskyi TaxID=96472 RepID=A0ABY3T0U1_9GAMM|nr:response regulator [Thiothrix winogradskyi]UJS25423.1 response regulator [Thiothrix winogradskyi]
MSALREALGEDIFEIFSEEVTEISETLQTLYPQWDKARTQRETLVEIRRAFHTLKGSGRMAGAFALGDFAWIHEDLLNHVMSGQLKADERVSAQIGKAVEELRVRLDYFLNASQKDARVERMIAEAETVLLPPEAAPLETWDFSAAEPVAKPALLPEALVEFAEPISVPESEPEYVLNFISDIEPESVPEPTADYEPVFDFTVNIEPESVPEPAPEVDDTAEADAESRMIWQLFWEEVPEQLQALDRNLQHLREAPEERDIIRELEREFHTLKGGARMAQLASLADVSHDAETLLSHLHGVGRVSDADIERLQLAVDQLHTLTEALHQPNAQVNTLPETVMPSTMPSTPVLAELPDLTPVAPLVEPMPAPIADAWVRQRSAQTESGSLLERLLLEQADSLPDISVLDSTSRATSAPDATPSTAAISNPHETIRLPAVFVDNLIDRVVELNVQQVHMSEHLSSMGMDVDELVRTVARLRQQIRTLEVESEARIHDGRSKRLQASKTAANDAGFDPLEMDQYAEVQRISRSLAESLNDLVNLEADLAAQVRKGEQLLQADMRTTRKLQRDLLDTRLVAVTMLVPRLRRLTRQVASDLGKQVALEVQGEDCELDRNLLQNMTAPLEHLIRNAISHGLETPEEREQAGKPRTGNITLTISRDDNEIVIRFRDDGRGLNRERLRERAIEMGLVGKGLELPEVELDRLILRPGFSTAATISQISGRGIGMDVVHSELKALGGSLQIASKPGEGTTFAMHLPFTLVVNPVLLVDVQTQVYALPITGVQGLARLSGQQIQAALQSGAEKLMFAGEAYALHHLAEVLGGQRAEPVFAADERFPVVFIQLQGQALAWVIDHVRGRREVVLQPLGTLFKSCRLYSAATVAPDGSVYLVPDMAELARLAETPPVLAPVLAVEELSAPDEPSGPPRVLVVDDSITVRRVTEKFLNSREYTVLTAKDGMEALERIAEFQPNVVLLDIEMPRMDGFELLGHLRRDPQWARLPVIMISSRTAQKHREHAGALGATGFLGKPYQNEVLLDALQEVLASGHEANNTHEWENLPA